MRVEDLLYRNRLNSENGIYFKDTFCSYQTLYIKAERLSEIIKNEKSHAICIFLPNSINYIIAYFAILMARKVVVPIHVAAKYMEIKSTYNYCNSSCIISDSASIGNDMGEKCRVDGIRLYDIEKEAYVENYVHLTLPREDVELCWHDENTDVAILLHTSGTTNNPKRVMLTQGGIIENILSHLDGLDLCIQDKTLIVLPMCFGYCHITQLLSQLMLGGDIIIMDGIFSAKYFFELIEKYKITYVTMVPTMFSLLQKYKYFSLHDYKSLKYIFFGGSKISIELLIEIMSRFSEVEFINTYGQTECGPRVTMINCRKNLEKISSVGLPIRGVKVKIVDENGDSHKCGEVGEIVVSSRSVMRGYYRREDMTKSVLSHGWIKTGDIGYVDQEGYIYICGRKKNVIITSGINVYPEEIEELLLQNDCVQDVLVYGKEDGMLGEKIVAKVVLKKDCSEKILLDFCRKKLAGYKVPKEIHIVKYLDKTYTGKNKR